MNNDLLEADLIRDESLELKPYRCTAGKLTIGVGRNLEDVGITRGEAMMLLRNDIVRVKAELDARLPWWKDLSEPRQRVLANMAFNMGIGKLMGFKKMLAAAQRGDYETAAAEMEDSPWYGQVKDRAKRLIELMREG